MIINSLLYFDEFFFKKTIAIIKKGCTFAVANDASVAQLVEHLTLNQGVQGSTPCGSTTDPQLRTSWGFFILLRKKTYFCRMKIHSISKRITRRIVLSMLLLMSFVAVLVFLFARSEITVLTSVHYQDMLKNTNDQVDGMLDKVEISAVNNLAEIQENLGSPEAVLDALEKELRLNPQLIGCGVGFNPDYFRKKDAGSSPTSRGGTVAGLNSWR